MTPKSWGIAVFGLTTGLYIAGLILVLMGGGQLWLNELLLPVVYAFAVVGFLIALKRPGNMIAWICLGGSFIWGLEVFSGGAVFYALSHSGEPGWLGAVAAIGFPLWIPGIFGLFPLLFLLFPDGRLPSPRWRWVLWVTVVGIPATYVFTVLVEEPYGYGRPSGIESPLAVLGPWFDRGGVMAEALSALALLLQFFPVVAAIVALIVRYRRSSGLEREQVKWLATAGSTAVIAFIISIFLVDIYGETVGLLAALPFVLIPISIGIAVLRYRLYDIDRLLSRTVSYALVVGLLAAVFAGVAIGIPQLLGMSGDTPPLLVAGATLAVAALFNPLRRRVQAMVDRRFNRTHYDARREVDRLSDQLRNDVRLDEVTDEVLDVVAKTMQPARASVWIRG